MLKERTGADAIENENMKAELIRDFSTIILIGGVYADRINGLDFIRKFRPRLPYTQFRIGPEGFPFILQLGFLLFSDFFPSLFHCIMIII